MFQSMLRILEAGLSIWETAQSRKYRKAVLDLKEKRAKELEKEHPDFDVVDKCERQLQWLGELFATEAKGQAFKDLQGQ
tara:strand:- start:2680 stop:2916 length:237 start_codon:yes stop_codon:yes gene_type:complete